MATRAVIFNSYFVRGFALDKDKSQLGETVYVTRFQALSNSSYLVTQGVHTSARLKRLESIEPDTLLLLERDGPRTWGGFKGFFKGISKQLLSKIFHYYNKLGDGELPDEDPRSYLYIHLHLFLHSYESHIFIISSSSFPGILRTNLMTSSQLA